MFSRGVLIFFWLVVSSSSFGWGLAVRMGPPGVGTGGPNPLNLPPSGTDLQLTHLTDQGLETNLSVTGLLVGMRHKSKWGGYVSLGGGLVISANGGGPGVYHAFGIDWGCGMFCWSVEMQHALGISQSALTSPYALRIGVVKWF